MMVFWEREGSIRGVLVDKYSDGNEIIYTPD